MKNNLLILFCCCIALQLFAQPTPVPVTFNVGINTTSPTRAKLEVLGVADGGATSGVFGSDGAGISLQMNWPTIGFNQYRDVVIPGSTGKYMANGFAALQYFDHNSGTMAFDMFPSGTANSNTLNGIRALTILGNGNVGIKTGSSFATLTVARGNGYDGTAVFEGYQHWSYFNNGISENTYIRAGRDAGNVYINRIPSGDVFIGNSNTRVGINNMSPVATIDIMYSPGQFALSLLDGYGYSWLQRMDYDGNGAHTLDFNYKTLSANTTKGYFHQYGYYYIFSDRRLKTQVEPLSSVLEKLNQLQPLSYEMKNHNPHHSRSLGFLAQQVKPLFPLLIREIKNKLPSGESVTDMHTMNYSGFGVIAIKALQEQFNQIQVLQEEQEFILQRLEALEKKLE